MEAEVARVLSRFRTYTKPDGLGYSPFKLQCALDGPATEEEIVSVWPAGSVPAELTQLWLICRQARLFEDIDYGQWGLSLLSPAAAAQRTAQEHARRPTAYRSKDVVIGEFLGDQELLVLATSKVEANSVLVALPLDERRDWYAVADSLADFLSRYLDAHGNKYWERVGRG